MAAGAGQLLAIVMACAAFRTAASLPSNHRALAQPQRERATSGDVERPLAPAGAAHHWPHVRGHVGAYGTTGLQGPADLAQDLAWSWHHPDGRYNSVMLGGALMDSKKNIYVFMEAGIFKLSPTGQQLWNHTAYLPYSNVGSIMGDAIFGNSVSGRVFALSLDTGKELWAHKSLHGDVGGDTAYVESHDGIVVSGTKAEFGGGNRVVMGLNASDGGELWAYSVSDSVVWNVMAMFPGDDTTVFMDSVGGVYRLGLHNGTEIWHTKAPGGNHSFSDGGLILGPDGDVYTCSNPENGTGEEGEEGRLRKYALADGRLLWDAPLPQPCNSWPAVSADGGTVIVVPGSFVGVPPTTAAISVHDVVGVPDMNTINAIHNGVLSMKNQRQSIGLPEVHASIMAFNATTGVELWRHDVPPYTGIAAAGDEEGLIHRWQLGHRTICLPAHWSSPTLDADGVVYVGRANGKLYKYSPATGESTYTTGAGPLHSGTTFAPGVMAFTDCDSLYVWNS